MAIRRILALAAALMLAASMAAAHGPHPHTHSAPVDDTRWSEEKPGFEAFIDKLAHVAPTLLAPEHVREFDEIRRHWATARAHRSSDAQEDQLMFRRHLAQAQGRLFQLLEHEESAIPISYKGGQLAMDFPGRIPTRSGDAVALFRIDFDGDGAGFHWLEHDLESRSEADDHLGLFNAPVGCSGRHFLLVEFPNPPREGGNFLIRLHAADCFDAPPTPVLLRTDPVPMGRAVVRVLDEHGEPTPAMMRLENAATRRLHRPSAAVEFAPQMDDIAGDSNPTHHFPVRAAGSPYPMWLSGDYAGNYWCVAGPSDMAMPAAEYDLVVRRGFEYIPVRRRFAVPEGGRVEVEVRLERWIDMPAKGWWSGDDHVHSRLMSDDDAERLLVWLEACDLHVASILKMGNAMRTWFEQRGFGREYRVVRGDRALVPGQEDPRHYHGHAIGLNISEQVRDLGRYLDNEWVSDEVRRVGGLYGHAHMVNDGFRIDRDLTLLMPLGKSDFGEILQSNILDTRLYYEFLNLGMPLVASAGSDVPFNHAMGEVRVYAHTGGGTLDVDAWFEAFGAGRTFVTNGPMLFLEVDGELPGATMRFDEDATVTVRARVVGRPGGGAPARLRVVTQGDTWREATNQDPGRTELSIEVEVPVGHGRWIAAEAASIEGTRAHTTPVYLVREGYRFWAVDKAPHLLRNRRATLDEIERDMRGYIEMVPGREGWEWNPYVTGLIDQAAGQLERLEAVRAEYDRLERLLEEELERRSGNE